MTEPEGSAPKPALFMTEIRAVDWRGAVDWYRDVLGLNLSFRDESGGFALFSTGEGRLAVKKADPETSADDRSHVRLVFRVADVDAEHGRLSALGVEATEPADHPREPYREIRLTAPEGTPITLFAWKVGS